MLFKCPLNTFIFNIQKIKLNGLVPMEYSTSQSIVFVINVFFSYCICSQFFCTGVQCGSVFVFSVFRAVHTDRKVSGGERRKRDTTDLATQDEQEQ